MKRFVLTGVLSLIAACAFSQGVWQELFDGKSFEGWMQVGGTATYHIERGVIVGTTVPDSPNSFLRTTRTYGNFILELEFKVDEGLNSGVQFRSQEVNGIVQGYQYEIDPDQTTLYKGLPANFDAEGQQIAPGTAPRSWTGGIYDEKRRGWIGDLTHAPEARAAFKPGKWNKIRIEARRDLLKTWINGVEAATVVDFVTPQGFIALQVHAVPEYKKMQIAWRKIRLLDLGDNPTEGDLLDQNQGEWLDASTGYLAQIYRDMESGNYCVNLTDRPWMNVAPITTLKATSIEGGLVFANEEGWNGVLERKRLKINGGSVQFDGQRIHRVSPTLGAKAPQDAEVLFDGEHLDKWGAMAPKEWLVASRDALEAVRLTPGGNIEITPGGGSIITRQNYRDFKLHLEFRLLGEKTNGGVYLLSRYEFNIKDSWGQGAGAPTGALGNVIVPNHPEPAINNALPPMVWQTLDIEFRAPRLDETGKCLENARATVYLNGELLYDDIEMERLKGAGSRLGLAEEGPIYLQEHGTAYQFRNIWIQKR